MSNATRQLTAIMFSDLVGFTSLMGSNEHKAMSVLKTNRDIHKRIIKKHGGRWLKEMADGTMGSFHSVSDAVYCAGDIIVACNEQSIDIRIGIHLGDVIEEDGDIFGDGVNVASRLEPLASPNQIMVSAPIHRNIKNKSGITSTFIEEKQLKNVDEPVRIYSVEVTGSGEEQDSYSAVTKRSKPFLSRQMLIGMIAVLIIVLGISYFFNPLGEGESTSDIVENIDIKKSIAVLPFVDMSPDQDQEYLGDGIAEEIINRLTKVKELIVIGRTSSFSFKTKETDLKTIGEMLRVETILEGSVQKSGNKLRITAQLINAEDGFHIWSESYDREFSDVFSIQDELSQLVVSKMYYDVAGNENKLVYSSDITNSDAYDLYLKAEYIANSRFYVSYKKEDFELAKKMFTSSINSDSTFALSHAGLSHLYNIYRRSFFLDDNNEEYLRLLTQEEKHLNIAYSLNPRSDFVNRVKGYYYEQFNEIDSAYKYLYRAVKINNKNTLNMVQLTAFLITKIGLEKESTEILKNAIKIDPLDHHLLFLLGASYRILGDTKSAIYYHNEVLKLAPDYVNCIGSFITLSLQNDDIALAQYYFELYVKKNPKSEITNFWVEKFNSQIFAKKGNKNKALEYSSNDEYTYVLLGMYDECIGQLINVDSPKRTQYGYLNNPIFDPLIDRKEFQNLINENKRKYDSLKTKFGNLDFLDL